MHVSLIGYRGTGKTTVARLVANALGCECVDADDEIERDAGCTIQQIFAEHGEPRFRDIEQDVVRRLCERDKLVVAMGGGAILRQANRLAMKKGSVVWLQASAETIFQRISADSSTAERRPQLTKLGDFAEISDLLEKRTPLYRECADYTIETDGKSPEQIANEIVSLIGD